MRYKAYQVQQVGLQQGLMIEGELPDLKPHSLCIEAVYSGLNYKDALAITGRGKILRQYPMIPGIDVAGIVKQSHDSRFKVGDSVLVTGCGLGEAQNGGFASFLQVPAEWAIRLPENLSMREAMIYGTAGFTVGLSLQRLFDNNQHPDLGPVVVTGASGGVGSFAVNMLSQLGFEVIAVSAKVEEISRLKSLGAQTVVRPEELDLGQKPLESVRFGGAIDSVGGSLLDGLLRHTNLWGNVASVGLAGGSGLSGTVMPFILRGVSLLGISSANCPMPLRLKIWQQLAKEWRCQNLASFVSQEIALKDLPLASEAMIARQSHGRTLVNLQT